MKRLKHKKGTPEYNQQKRRLKVQEKTKITTYIKITTKKGLEEMAVETGSVGKSIDRLVDSIQRSPHNQKNTK